MLPSPIGQLPSRGGKCFVFQCSETHIASIPPQGKNKEHNPREEKRTQIFSSLLVFLVLCVSLCFFFFSVWEIDETTQHDPSIVRRRRLLKRSTVCRRSLGEEVGLLVRSLLLVASCS